MCPAAYWGTRTRGIAVLSRGDFGGRGHRGMGIERGDVVRPKPNNSIDLLVSSLSVGYGVNVEFSFR